jgi:hypothetical protein
MQKSYIVKRPVNFADYNFFVKVGDILVHDTQNNNRLTVYRNGEIVKTLSQTFLGLKAMVMNDFIGELGASPAPKPAPAPAPVKEAPKAEEPVKMPKKGLTAEEYTPAVKRGKAVPKEVKAEDLPPRLKEALAPKEEKLDIPDETI